jgi:uncharacterized protein YkwD
MTASAGASVLHGRPPRIALFLLAAGLLLAGAASPPSPAPGRSDASAAPLVLPDTVDDPRPDYTAAGLERAIHDAVNAVRAERGLPRLEWADSLRVLARTHSRDMMDRDFFAHTNPSGEDVNDRGRRLGLQCHRALPDNVWAVGFSENLYEGSLYRRVQKRYRGDRLLERIYDWKPTDALATAVVQGWMNSPGHRKNLLSDVSRVESIGVVIEDRRFVVTQVLC